jgi:hypothetical protein
MIPTDEEISKVQTNLSNMQTWNDRLYAYGNPKIINAFALLDQSDNQDRGLTDVLNLLDGAFWAIGGELGPIGAIGANVMCGLVAEWSNTAPPDMNNAFSSLLSRFEAASLDVDRQLAVYHEDPATYWDTTFTAHGETCTLGDLATIDFPSEADPGFYTLLDPAVFALDQTVWSILLNAFCYNVRWSPDVQITGDITSWLQMFYARNLSYWCAYYQHQDTGDCGDYTYWNVTEHNVSFGAGRYNDGHISEGACAYLFIDSTDGTVINSQGLYERAFVFNNLGLRTQSIYESMQPSPILEHLGTEGVTAAQAVGTTGWFRYMRAKKDGKPLLSDLEERVGIEGVKQLILDAVKEDPTLRSSFRTRPHQTMERVLGVIVPEFVEFNITVEGPRRHGLVIPLEDSDA